MAERKAADVAREEDGCGIAQRIDAGIARVLHRIDHRLGGGGDRGEAVRLERAAIAEVEVVVHGGWLLDAAGRSPSSPLPSAPVLPRQRTG